MIKSTLEWLSNEPRQRIGLRILQVAIGSMLLFRCLTEFRFSSYLWGPQGLASGSNRLMFGTWLGDLLDLFFVSDLGVKALLLILMVAALGLVLGRSTRVATAVACLTFIMFENRLADLFDGGDNITRLSLCYLLFAIAPGEKWTAGSLKVWFHNLAMVAVVVQLMVLYLTSGFVKATGEPWSSGTAMYLISQVDTYSLPQMRPLMKNSLVVTLFAYATVFFQIWFPVAVMSRLKFVWLAVGIGMHLGIATMMGLLPFSTVMIGLELFLITDCEFRQIGERYQQARQWLFDQRARWRLPTPSLTVFLDGACAHCRAVGRVLALLDQRGRLRLLSFREGEEHLALRLAPAALERRMHLVDRSGTVVSGFAAVVVLCRNLPLLWPLLLPLKMLEVLGLGEMSYDFLADRRFIMLDGRACAGEGACALAPAKSKTRTS